MCRRLERITPADTGLFKRSWKVKTYPNAGYIYNERGAGGIDKGAPISNIAEFSRRGPDPFIFSAWEKNKNEIKEIFIKEFERRFN